MSARAGDVSVVIPTFDRASVLARAVDSVVAQTHSPAEVIVVDDGSTDDTAELVERRFPSVRLLRQENRGVSAARNRGIEASGGEWIALLDSDDEWRPSKLERQMSGLEERPELRVCHTDEIWIRQGRRVNPRQIHAKHGGWIFEHCLPLCAMSPSSILIHRSIFEVVGMFDEELPACEDYDLWLRICSRYPVLYVDEPLVVKHGGHEDQLSRQVWGLDRFRIQALEKVIDSGHLNEADWQASVAMLLKKIEIYLEGTRRRGRREEAAQYEQRLQHWRCQLHLMEQA
ncbi:MAG: glycosyltransferase family A protein [Thermoanaerobaculia bacterium]